MSEQMKPAFDFLEELKAIVEGYDEFKVKSISIEHYIQLEYEPVRKRISVCVFYKYGKDESNFSVHCFENSSRMNMDVLKAKMIEEITQITSSKKGDIAV